MKEFEKWNKEQHHFVLKREVWRAALEWAKKTAQFQDCDEMEYMIDEELQDD